MCDQTRVRAPPPPSDAPTTLDSPEFYAPPCRAEKVEDNKYIDGIPENFYDTKASGSRAFLPNRFRAGFDPGSREHFSLPPRLDVARPRPGPRPRLTSIRTPTPIVNRVCPSSRSSNSRRSRRTMSFTLWHHRQPSGSSPFGYLVVQRPSMYIAQSVIQKEFEKPGFECAPLGYDTVRISIGYAGVS